MKGGKMNKKILIVFLALILIIAGCIKTKENLVHIKIVARVEENNTITNKSINSMLVCNLNNGKCGNVLYYNQGQGFYWMGLQNASGLKVYAYVVKD